MSKVPARGPIRSGARLRLKAGNPNGSNTTIPKAVESKEKDRSYRLAFGSLAVSVIVAITSPLSAWLVADKTVNASGEQASDDFMRDQRIVAYSDFVSADSALERSLNALSSKLEAWSDGQRGQSDLDELAALRDVARADGTELSRKRDVVQFVSGKKTLNAANVAMEDRALAYQALSGTVRNLLDPGGNITGRSITDEDLQYTLQSAVSYDVGGHSNIRQFIGCGRLDLAGTPSDPETGLEECLLSLAW